MFGSSAFAAGAIAVDDEEGSTDAGWALSLAHRPAKSGQRGDVGFQEGCNSDGRIVAR
jgi:hypothetical protein